MEFAILRLDAPMMSAGRVAIDIHRPTGPLPTQSMLTGMLCNALGYSYGDPAQDDLQSRLEYAARADRSGSRFIDYQTVQVYKSDRAWTTVGVAVDRRGGWKAGGEPSGYIRYPEYLADAAWTVVMRVEGMSASQIVHAFDYPERVIFIGRKCCLPSGRIAQGTIEAPDVLSALRAVPGVPGTVPATWPAHLGSDEPRSRVELAYDTKRWREGVHRGSRSVRNGVVDVVGA